MQQPRFSGGAAVHFLENCLIRQISTVFIGYLSRFLRVFSKTVRRCSFICGAVLSILLLLCSCQAGAGQLILPDNIPSENTSQGKKELLAALNTIGIRRPETTQDSYIPGADSVAETIFLCIQKKSGNNAAAAIKLLSANEVTGFANCANVVLNRLSPSPDETYFVSYALLSADVLEDGALREDVDLSAVARTLLANRSLLVLSDVFQPDASQKIGFAVGVIGGQALVVAVFVS